MPPTTIFPTADAIGHAVASEIVIGLVEATAAGRPYVLGAPSGRTPRSTYRALADLLQGRTDVDVTRLQLVMMDDYVVREPGRRAFSRVRPELPYSCERFAREEILAPLAAVPGRTGVPERNLHLPDPADPAAYDELIAGLGGVDLFILATGASDGHVAFNPPGSAAASLTRVVELSEQTRRDNMLTFAPHFRRLEDVPRHGVTVGIETIRRHTRRAAMLAIGAGKQKAAAVIAAAEAYSPDWPATIVSECENPSLYLDPAAAAALPASRPAEAR
ncbi:MAG TPA: 6-phosphogluconolactonase [Gryllotalpicola sp.]